MFKNIYDEYFTERAQEVINFKSSCQDKCSRKRLGKQSTQVHLGRGKF